VRQDTLKKNADREERGAVKGKRAKEIKRRKSRTTKTRKEKKEKMKALYPAMCKKRQEEPVREGYHVYGRKRKRKKLAAVPIY